MQLCSRAGFAVLIALVCLGAGCSKEARRDRHLKRANGYYEAQDYPKAVIEYLNALRLDPENSVGLSRLGKAYYEQGQLNRAFPLLLRTQKLDPKDVEVRIELARIYSEAQDMTNARKLAAEILAIDPGNEEALLILADTAVTPEEKADIDRRVQALRARGGDRAVFHLVSGIASLRQKEMEKAELAFKEALSLDPKSPFATRILGTFYFLRGNLDAARAQHEQEIKLSPRDRFARLRYADFKTRTGSLQDARSILEEITKDSPDFVPAWSCLAALAFEEKRYDDCRPLVGRVLAQRPEDFRALMLQAGLNMVKRDVQQGIEDYKKIRSLYARVPQVHFQLARAYLATNDIANALSSLDQAVALNPNFTDALFLLGQISVRKGDYAKAITVFGELSRQNPRMTAAQLFLGEAYRARGSLDEALAVFERLATSSPTNTQPLFLAGLVYRQQKKEPDAEEAFTKVLRLNPGDVATVNQLVEMKLLRKDFQSAQKLADDLMTRTPRSGDAWFIRARLLMAQADLRGAEAALLKTIELDTNALAAYSALAKLYVNSQRVPQAVAKLDEVLARAPNNIPALMQKAMVFEQITNYARASESYEVILAAAPRFGLALNNLAYIYSEHLPKLDRAYELATRAREVLTESPEATDTFGWILFKRGEYARALVPLTEAATQLPDTAEVQFHLGMAHYMQGQEKEARALLSQALRLSKSFPGAEEAQQRLAMLEGDVKGPDPEAQAKLEKLLARQPNDPVGLMRLADFQIRDGSWAKARASLEQVLTLNPQSVPALVKLARLDGEKLNNPAKSLEWARRARGLAPNDLQAGHILGRLGYQAGDHLWAAGVLEEVVQKSPPQSDLLWDFAWALYSVGRIDEARDRMRQVLNLTSSPTNVAPARQFLDLTGLALNPESDPQAATTVQAALKVQPDYLPALVALAAVQAQKGDKEVRQSYEKILARYPQFSPALKALVTLPDDSSPDAKSYEWAKKARKLFPGDPQVAKAVGRLLYKRGEFAAAATPLQEAVRTLKDDAEAHYYLGMTRHKLGNQQQAKLDLQRASALGLQGQPALDVMRVLGGAN